MKPLQPDLRSVNWTTGMLLTPDHFLMQDGFAQGSLLWMLKYATTGSGLLGAGPRLSGAEQGLAGHDPVVDVVDEGDVVAVAVGQVRALTPVGQPISVPAESPVRGRFPKDGLGDISEFLVHVVWTGSRQPEQGSLGVDEDNPTTPLVLAPAYELRIGISPEETSRAVVVGRIRRASESTEFEVDGEFIPKAATLLGHSSLFAGCRRVQNEIVSLAARFAEVHRGVSRYIAQVSPRGVDVSPDREIQSFIERAALALDACAHDTMDPAQSPDRFFQVIQRTGRTVALGLELSPATQLFFETLTGADGLYGDLLRSEREHLSRGRRIRERDDLRMHLDESVTTLRRLRRLLEGLEGKYVDYRINTSVSSLRFLLDRGGEHFYQAVSTSSHAQRDGSLLTFVFSDLNLKGRKEYRVLLVGDPDEPPVWQIGEKVACSLRINAAASRGRPRTENLTCEIPNQRNFAFNFVTPDDVDTINGLHLAVEPAQTIRTAILFQRRLGLASDPTPQPSSWSDPTLAGGQRGASGTVERRPAGQGAGSGAPSGATAGDRSPKKTASKIKIRPRKPDA